jgi:Domain of unknown function (DUF4157)
MTVHATQEHRKQIAARPVANLLRSPGRPLEAATRRSMESRFWHDFSQVRIHADERAAQAASSLSARAFTVGTAIVFAAGQYAPQTGSGRRLLAHELTHVVQQRHGVRLNGVGAAGDVYESQADAVATRVALGRDAGAALPSALRRTTASEASPAQSSVHALQLVDDPKPKVYDSSAYLQKRLADMFSLQALRDPIAKKLAHEYFIATKPAAHAHKMTDAEIERSESGNGPAPERTEEDVFIAIMGGLQLKDYLKGKSAADWTLEGPKAHSKSNDDKGEEFLSVAKGHVQDELLGKMALELSARWVARGFVFLATYLTGLAEAYAVYSTAMELVDIAKMLFAPRDLSPAEEKNAEIARDVQDWLLQKQMAKDLQSIYRPDAARNDKTAVVLHGPGGH